jgi:hypothetical protein
MGDILDCKFGILKNQGVTLDKARIFAQKSTYG